MKKPPNLTLVETAATAVSPRRKSETRGGKLKRSVLSDYEIDDAGGIELLNQVCAAVDRLDDITKRIERDGGIMVRGRSGQRAHPLLKVETALRVFVVRSLQKLGLEPVQPSVGRPGHGFGITTTYED